MPSIPPGKLLLRRVFVGINASDINFTAGRCARAGGMLTSRLAQYGIGCMLVRVLSINGNMSVRKPKGINGDKGRGACPWYVLCVFRRCAWSQLELRVHEAAPEQCTRYCALLLPHLTTYPWLHQMQLPGRKVLHPLSFPMRGSLQLHPNLPCLVVPFDFGNAACANTCAHILHTLNNLHASCSTHWQTNTHASAEAHTRTHTCVRALLCQVPRQPC